MKFLQKIYIAIGRSAVADLVQSGQMEQIVSNAVASHFEKMAAKTEYKELAPVLERAAKCARSSGG